MSAFIHAFVNGWAGLATYSSRVAASSLEGKTPAQLFSQATTSQDGHSETKLRCRMQNNDDNAMLTTRNGTMMSGASSSASAAQTVSASVVELARTVEQTEARLRTQVRLNLVLVVLNLLTLWVVYLNGRGGAEGGRRDSQEEL